jgi:NAD(P)H dehydrogenase (quinone)
MRIIIFSKKDRKRYTLFMQVFIVYAHPSEDSFTRRMKDSFIRGLESAGRSYIVSDLYKMQFKTDISEAEYLREGYYRREAPVPDDVAAEQAKINASGAIVFIYPVFWSDAPAKLVGWFDRVWTYGFAYGENRTMKQLEKGLCLCSAGNTMEYLHETGILESMKRVMLGDRLFDRVKAGEMIVLDGTSRETESRKANWDDHLRRAFEAGAAL